VLTLKVIPYYLQPEDCVFRSRRDYQLWGIVPITQMALRIKNSANMKFASSVTI